nr:scavenger receptor class B member 1-like [Leptinotarsa decemlineata]
MYPNLETVRRNSDTDRISDSKLSYLEKNCSQIFMKGPALTKEILEKVNADLVPKKTYLLGYEMKTKTVLLITGLCLLFSLSCSATSVIWFTDAFDNYVLSQLVLTNNEDSFKMWKNPTPKVTYKLYIFNYTNVQDYKDGLAEKLHVDDVGPYTYEEKLDRENVNIIDDERITFQERRTYSFRPDLSAGSQNDQVTVPNIPLISGSAVVKHNNFFTRLAYDATLRGLDLQAFVTLPAHDFITGYYDRLYAASRVLSSFDDVQPPETFALLASKIGLNPRVITMNTGIYDYNKIGQFEKINGQDILSYFETDECNSLQSGDGAMYPPPQVQQKKNIYFMFPELCRRMPLVFENETTIFNGKVPAYRYVLPEDIFDSPEEKPENQCYCNSNKKCLKGIFNTTACNFSEYH